MNECKCQPPTWDDANDYLCNACTDMAIAADSGLPFDGEARQFGDLIYEWEVIEEVDESHDRWGWRCVGTTADFYVTGFRTVGICR